MGLGVPLDAERGAGAVQEDDAAALGSALLLLVERADAAGVDAEAALRAAVRGVETRIRASENPASGATATAAAHHVD